MPRKTVTSKDKTPPNPWGRYFTASINTQKAMVFKNNTDGTKTYHQIRKRGASLLYDSEGSVLEGTFKSICSTPIKPKSSSTHFTTPEGSTKVHTPGGTEYDSKRKINIAVKGQGNSTLLFLSPTKSKRTFLEELEGIDPKKRLSFNDAELTIKGGKEIKVQSHARDRKKAKSQLAVMKHPAKDAMFTFLTTHKTRLSPELYKVLIAATTKSRTTEWCHGAGFSLCPKSYEPQVKENLGAAFAWINTFMMVLEQVASHFVKRYPNSVFIRPTFYMIPHTDVIAKIKYRVKISTKGHLVSASNEINTLEGKNRSSWPTVWDTDYTIQTIEALLEGKLTCGADKTKGTVKKKLKL